MILNISLNLGSFDPKIGLLTQFFLQITMLRVLTPIEGPMGFRVRTILRRQVLRYDLFPGSLMVNQWDYAVNGQSRRPMISAVVFLGIIPLSDEEREAPMHVRKAVILDNERGLVVIRLDSLSHMPSSKTLEAWLGKKGVKRFENQVNLA